MTEYSFEKKIEGRPLHIAKKRDFMMDNVKALLLFLVAFGHTLDVYKGSGGVELYIMKYIYLFHMPLFAFITGYFTKNFERARETAVEKCLMPYLIFQGVYVIMANVMIYAGLASFNSDVFNSSILIPSSAFYYLLAVFFWKIFAKDIMRVKYPLILAVLLGLTIGDIEGIVYRLIFYITAVIMGAAIICLMPRKETFISNIGKASILVYAGSTFLAPHGYVLIDKICRLSGNRIMNMTGMIIYCMCLVLFCSIPLFLKWYNHILGMLNKWIFKGDER